MTAVKITTIILAALIVITAFMVGIVRLREYSGGPWVYEGKVANFTVYQGSFGNSPFSVVDLDNRRKITVKTVELKTGQFIYSNKFEIIVRSTKLPEEKVREYYE